MRVSHLAVACAAATAAFAHGPETPEEVRAFHALQASAYHCAPAVAAYTAQRKRNWAQKVLGAAPLSMKQYFVEDGLKENHVEAASSSKQIMACDPVSETKIKNSTCVLSPETTEGPYYHTEGHPIRSNMAENELGLLFLMNVGVIDVETCEPLPDVLVDLWHCNSTGYYAGHPWPKKGLENEKPASSGRRKGLMSAYPRDSNYDHETWLRGALPTDKNGVTEFTSVFPGYYTGRATHVHVKVHPEWEQLPNGTFTSGRLIHTGQFFFEDDINMQVDKLHPYNENPLLRPGKGGRTRNWDDSLQIFQDSFDNGYMPTFDVEFLGGVLQQGLIGYITMGVNMSASYEAKWTPESGRGGIPAGGAAKRGPKTEL
ncbi:unnamed protein product [Parajaminaea phylloscopi]